MKIKFYAHASFRLEGEEIAIVTDPYTPGPNASQFAPIHEDADIVVMSSATDRFHSDPSHVWGDPVVVNAVDIPASGLTVKGILFRAFQTMESLTFDFGREPDPNAMYWFELEGVRVLHIGDIGNPIAPKHLQQLAGTVDVMFALTGEHATIALDDLDQAIREIQPRVVIPMHYYNPRGVLQIEPVESFTERYPNDAVTFVNGPELSLEKSTLPTDLHIFVLGESR